MRHLVKCSSVPEPTIHDHPRVLFICTGNYYRSRFAEALFNHHAQRNGLPWRAFSRGLALFFPQGDISPHVIQGLARRAIDLPNTAANPAALTTGDLEHSTIRVALYEPEHRPMIARQFPGWENRVTYWRVPDLGEMEPEEATALIETEVLRLVEELKRESEEREERCARHMAMSHAIPVFHQREADPRLAKGGVTTTGDPCLTLGAPVGEEDNAEPDRGH